MLLQNLLSTTPQGLDTTLASTR